MVDGNGNLSWTGSIVISRGKLADAVRDFDWSHTPLGPIEQWPQSLRTTVQIMLSSRYAMWMAWGPELTFFCNDAYRPTLGIKHPWALGKPASEPAASTAFRLASFARVNSALRLTIHTTFRAARASAFSIAESPAPITRTSGWLVMLLTVTQPDSQPVSARAIP